MSVNIYAMSDTWNAIGTTFNSIAMDVTNGAGGNPVGAAASQLLNLTTNTTQRFGVRSPHFALGTDVTPFLNMVDIWNTSGAAVGLKYNVTDTASASGALLLDMQVGGSSVFKIRKDGIVTIASSGALTVGNVSINYTANNQIAAPSNGQIGFGSTTALGASLDTILIRDAANTFAQVNGTSAQTFNIYNTSSSSNANYERVGITWSSNVCYMKPSNAGTGSARLFIPVTGSTTVASLPSAATAGAGGRSFVTDATATTYLSTVAGGGANKVPVVSDGTSWLIG